MLAIRNQHLIQSFNSISTRNLSTAANLSRATPSSNLNLYSSRSLHSTRRSNMSSPPTLNFKDTQISLIQLGQTSKDKSFNLSHAKHFINKASSQSPKPDLIVLPECFNSPYGVNHFADYAEDLQGLWEKVKDPLPNKDTSGDKEYQPFESDPTSTVRGNFTIDGKDGRSIDVQKEGFQSETLNMLSQSARENQIVLIGGSIPEKDKDGKLYNTSLVFNQQGHVISMFRKVHLFDIDIPGKMTFQESLTLTGGDRVTVFECSQGLFGLAICYDLRFPEPAQIAARMGAGAMIYPGAFNTTTGPRHWELLQRSRATDNQLYVCACSPARPSEKEIEEKKSYPSWGHSTVVNPWSEVVATTDEKEGIVNWKLEKSQIEEVRKMIPIGTQRRWDVYRDVGRV